MPCFTHNCRVLPAYRSTLCFSRYKPWSSWWLRLKSEIVFPCFSNALSQSFGPGGLRPRSHTLADCPGWNGIKTSFTHRIHEWYMVECDGNERKFDTWILRDTSRWYKIGGAMKMCICALYSKDCLHTVPNKVESSMTTKLQFIRPSKFEQKTHFPRVIPQRTQQHLGCNCELESLDLETANPIV